MKNPQLYKHTVQSSTSVVHETKLVVMVKESHLCLMQFRLIHNWSNTTGKSYLNEGVDVQLLNGEGYHKLGPDYINARLHWSDVRGIHIW